ncbi:MAG: small subunit ribosomal protein [Candidatus Woesearchaeota archaeon]|nr:small subunit ribosomal protein [Candidatus Woesearchaeota archaeon]MDN5327979.1 small subunit ribosomal protein [Candidatus Woesearchaeota archaeon]
MAKQFTYRGKTLEELKKLSLNEFAQLLCSRERRKIQRGLTEAEKKLVEKLQKKDFVKTHCRDMIILPSFVGKTIGIHNGKTFVSVKIVPEMIGRRLGEFAPTRSEVKHSSPGIGATRSTAHASVK